MRSGVCIVLVGFMAGITSAASRQDSRTTRSGTPGGSGTSSGTRARSDAFSNRATRNTNAFSNRVGSSYSSGRSDRSASAPPAGSGRSAGGRSDEAGGTGYGGALGDRGPGGDQSGRGSGSDLGTGNRSAADRAGTGRYGADPYGYGGAGTNGRFRQNGEAAYGAGSDVGRPSAGDMTGQGGAGGGQSGPAYRGNVYSYGGYGGSGGEEYRGGYRADDSNYGTHSDRYGGGGAPHMTPYGYSGEFDRFYGPETYGYAGGAGRSDIGVDRYWTAGDAGTSRFDPAGVDGRAYGSVGDPYTTSRRYDDLRGDGYELGPYNDDRSGGAADPGWTGEYWHTSNYPGETAHRGAFGPDTRRDTRGAPQEDGPPGPGDSLALVGRVTEEAVRLPGLDPRNRLIRVRSATGRRFLVDLGARGRAEALDIGPDESIFVRGDVISTAGHRVLVAREVGRVTQMTLIDRDSGEDRRAGLNESPWRNRQGYGYIEPGGTDERGW